MLPLFQAQCQEVRKRKELELQILSESIRLWEGDDIKTLGSVLYMSQVLVQSPGSEVPTPSENSLGYSAVLVVCTDHCKFKYFCVN